MCFDEKEFNNSLLMGEIRTLLAMKRTSLAVLRTAIAILAVPLSIFTVLMAASKYYDIWSMLYPLLLLLLGCMALLGLGIYFIVKSFLQMRLYDRKIRVITKKTLFSEDSIRKPKPETTKI